MTTSPDSWSAADYRAYHRTIRRHFTTSAAVVAVAVVGTVILATFDTAALEWPYLAVLAGLAAWTLLCVARARRSTSQREVERMALTYLLVWANWTLVMLIATFTWALAMQRPMGDAILVIWATIGLLAVGYVAIYLRARALTDRGVDEL